MTKYEKLTIKLKMVELLQNQTLIALKAEQIGTEEALEKSKDMNNILDKVVPHVDVVLSK